MLDLGYDYYLIKFDDHEDLDRVLNKGPCVIQDHYLTVKKIVTKF